MIALYLFIGALIGFSTAALFSARAYDKGYKDAKEERYRNKIRCKGRGIKVNV